MGELENGLVGPQISAAPRLLPGPLIVGYPSICKRACPERG